MRTFQMTDKYVGNTTVLRRVINYKWSKGKGLQCEMFPNHWVKSEYNLKEFLSGMAGNFVETTK